MAIKYKGRYQQVKYLAGGKGSEFRPGAMSEIVVVEDLSTPAHTQYVLKRPVVSDRSGQRVSLSEQNTALVREYSVLKMLNEHLERFGINFPQVIEFGKDVGNFSYEHNYIITNFVPGLPLTFEPPPPLIASLNAFNHVLMALEKIHQLGIIVNDTRHEHIYWEKTVDPTGEKPNSISMLDFGNARFLPFSPESLLALNAEGNYQASEKDDYRQLGESLFRQLTGSNAFPGQNWMNVFTVRSEYQQVRLLCDESDLALIIQYLLSNDAELAQSKIEEIINTVSQTRKSIIADIEERKNDFSDFNAFIDELNKQAQIIGSFTEDYKNRWKNYYETLRNREELENSISQLKENVKNSNWPKILSSNIGVIGKYDEKKANLLGELVFLITQQDKKVEIQMEGIFALNHIADGEYADAYNQVREIIRLHYESGARDPDWEKLYIPFYSSICKYSDRPRSIISHPNAISELKSARSFQEVDNIYVRYLNDTKDDLFRSSLDASKSLRDAWNRLAIPEIEMQLANFLEEDEFNPFYKILKNDLLEFRKWANNSYFDLKEIPHTIFKHDIFEDFPKFESKKSQAKLDFLYVLEATLISCIQNPQMKQSLLDWLDGQKEKLRESIVEWVNRIFENEIDTRDLFNGPNDSLLKYLKEKDADWYRILSYTFKIDQGKDDISKLKELNQNMQLERRDGKNENKWEFLQQVTNFRIKRISGGSYDNAVIDALVELSQQVTSNHSNHWLVKNIKYYYSKKSGHLEDTVERPWWALPEVTFVGGFLSAAIIMVIAFLIFGKLFFSPTIPLPATPVNLQPSNLSDCNTVVSLLEKHEYKDTIELLSDCETQIDKSRMSDEVLFSIRGDLYKKQFNLDASMLMAKVQGWNPDNDQYFDIMEICGKFLNIIDQNQKQAETYFTDNMSLSPISEWEFYCGWNPSQLLLDSNDGIQDFSGSLGSLSVGDNYILDYVNQGVYKNVSNQYLDFRVQLVPQLNAGQIDIPLQIGFNDKLEDIDLTSIPDFVMKSQKILLLMDWHYQDHSLVVAYKIFASEDTVKIKLESGETFLHLEQVYGVNTDELKRFNGIDNLFAGSEIYLIDPATPRIDGVFNNNWFQVGSKEFSFDVENANTYYPVIRLEAELPIQYGNLSVSVDANKR